MGATVMRKIEKRMWNKSGNPLWHVYQTVSFGKVLKNTVTIEIARYLPFFRMKNWLYRKVLKMTVGAQVTFVYKVMIDILFPEKISVGDNTIIGYQTTILAHEYLVNEYRVGTVQIGSNVMIGANCTILPGVTIGDGAIIAAGTVVYQNVPPHVFVSGQRMEIQRQIVL